MSKTYTSNKCGYRGCNLHIENEKYETWHDHESFHITNMENHLKAAENELLLANIKISEGDDYRDETQKVEKEHKEATRHQAAGAKVYETRVN